MKKILLLALTALVIAGAKGAGFGIYEASSRGNALGGALVGSTKDASSVYYNPANMTECTNVSVMVGATLINPFCDVEVDGVSQQKMDAGWFIAPTFYAVVPLPWDFAFGIGGYSEFGLGTRYGRGWDLAADTQETTMKQYTLNPNLAYKITDWWSIAGGLKLSYITFNNKKQPYYGEMPLPEPYGYHLNSELDGDDYGIGYDFGTQFKLTKKLSLGINYRSQIKHNIKGDFDLGGSATLPAYLANGTGTSPITVPQSQHSSASAKLTLPQSISVGLNYEATDDWRLGAVATWTEWSSVDSIRFKIPKVQNGGFTLPLQWNDVWRFGFGTEYDFIKDWSVRGGYIYDMDPSSDNHGTTMLPAGDRHILTSGLGWRITENMRIDVGYSFIIMEGEDRDVKLLKYDGTTYTRNFKCRNSFSHLISAGLTYEF